MKYILIAITNLLLSCAQTPETLQCTTNNQCEAPMNYLIQSNCPFNSLCLENKCQVVCPLTYHDKNAELNKSHQFMCEEDSDCDCSNRGNNSIACKCVDGECYSVEGFIS